MIKMLFFIASILFSSVVFCQNNLTIKELRASQIRGLYTGFKQDGSPNDSTVNLLYTDYDPMISPKSLITVNDTLLREWIRSNSSVNYESAPFTPSFGNTGGDLVILNDTAYYVKVGNQVNVWIYAAFNSNTHTGLVEISNLPFLAIPISGIPASFTGVGWATNNGLLTGFFSFRPVIADGFSEISCFQNNSTLIYSEVNGEFMINISYPTNE